MPEAFCLACLDSGSLFHLSEGDFGYDGRPQVRL
jgi:hypothetical protein